MEKLKRYVHIDEFHEKKNRISKAKAEAIFYSFNDPYFISQTFCSFPRIDFRLIFIPDVTSKFEIIVQQKWIKHQKKNVIMIDVHSALSELLCFLEIVPLFESVL